jgi:hypothetical protein
MSKETTMAQKTETQKHDRGVVHLALDVADRGQSTVLAVLNDARVEVRSAVDHTIELAEKLATGAFRFARKLTSRVDDASTAALANVERRVASAVREARETKSPSAKAQA